MKRLALLATMVLTGVSSVMAATVKSDFDSTFEFTRPKTFTWTTRENKEFPFAHPRIINAIEAQLTAKGMLGVDAGGDVNVAYHVALGKRTEITDWGYRPRWGNSIDVYQYTEGTIVVDMIDATHDKLVWRGSASDAVSDKPETNEKRMNKAMAKLFKKFPPVAK